MPPKVPINLKKKNQILNKKDYKVIKKKAYKSIARNKVSDFYINNKAFRRIIYTPLGRKLRANKELNKALLFLLENKQKKEYVHKDFKIKRLNHKNDNNIMHSDTFQIKIKIGKEKKNLFLKLYNSNNYQPKNITSIEVHKGHNEFIALEQAKQLGFKTIPAHLGFTSIKTVNGINILKSGIMYDFTNLIQLEKYLSENKYKAKIKLKHTLMQGKLEEHKIRDAFSKNIFIDPKTEQLYLFDLYTMDVNLNSLEESKSLSKIK